MISCSPLVYETSKAACKADKAMRHAKHAELARNLIMPALQALHGDSAASIKQQRKLSTCTVK
jgi:hypothetical protein